MVPARRESQVSPRCFGNVTVAVPNPEIFLPAAFGGCHGAAGPVHVLDGGCGGAAHCVHHLLAGESMLSEGKRDQADGAAPARRPWVLSVSRAWRSVHLPGGRQERVGPGCWHLGHFAGAKPFPGFLTDTPTLWGPSEGPPSGSQL